VRRVIESTLVSADGVIERAMRWTMSRTVVVRYETRPEVADDNQGLIEAVFDQLAVDDPGGLRYAVFRLADGVTFVHVAIVEGETDPLPMLSAFAEFQRGHGDRTVGPPVVAGATLLGAYRFVTP
jgi:hypothetical protein